MEPTAWTMDPELKDAIEEGFEILEFEFTAHYVQFIVQPRLGDINRSHLIVKERLEPSGRIPFLREKEGKLVLVIGLLPYREETGRPWINLLLFVATIVSTLFAGYTISLGFLDLEWFTFSWRALGLAGLFSFSIMTIIGLHEVAHYIQSKRSGVKATFPYFLPFPITPIGTLGAFIQIRSPIPNRKDLFRIGFSGPFMSFGLSVVALIIGIYLSPYTPHTPEEGGMFVGTSLLFEQLVQIIKGPYIQALTQNPDIAWYFHPGALSTPPRIVMSLHPIAFAGWVGLLVTSINLFPIGQLDGGHISRAILGQAWARRVSWAAIGALIILGSLFNYEGWWIWAFLAFMLGGRGVNPLDDVTKVDFKYLILGIVAIIVFILSFIPVPFLLQ